MQRQTIRRRMEFLATVVWALRLAIKDLERQEQEQTQTQKKVGWRQTKTKQELNNEFGRSALRK